VEADRQGGPRAVAPGRRRRRMCFKTVPTQDVTNLISLSSVYCMYGVPLLLDSVV
jgi:hypothetical protein